jgi:hypothetical protein
MNNHPRNNNNNNNNVDHVANPQAIIQIKVQDYNEKKVHSTKMIVQLRIIQLNSRGQERAVIRSLVREEAVKEDRMLNHLTITVKKYKTKSNLLIKGVTGIFILIVINMGFKILSKENLYLVIINPKNHKDILMSIK